MMLYVKVVSKLEFGAVFHKDAKRTWIYLHISECRGIWWKVDPGSFSLSEILQMPLMVLFMKNVKNHSFQKNSIVFNDETAFRASWFLTLRF